MLEIKIKDRLIGSGHPCYLVAEMSANHGGSYEKALAILRAAKSAGADAIKLQTYTPDTMTLDCDNQYFQLQHPLWNNKTLYQLYKQAQTPWQWHKSLQEEAKKIGIHFFSTPFDESSVDFLEELNVPAYKISSFELVDDPLLKRVASTQKPVIMSTGMATFEEIDHAVQLLRSHGTEQLALLRCSSSYPAQPQEMRLALMGDMEERFNTVVGLSDHTVNGLTAVAAVALGASIIEKHIKMEDNIVTPDETFSLSVSQFQNMVRDVRLIEQAVGEIVYGTTKMDASSLLFRRSIFVVKPIHKGDVFSKDNVRIIRPGYGMSPVHFEKILGKKANQDISPGVPLKESMIYA